MIQLKSDQHRYIHTIAVEHVRLLQKDTISPTQGTQMEIALYEEMIAHRLKYSGDWIGVVLDEQQRLIAYAWAHYEQASRHVTIESIFVATAYRQQGYAKTLKEKIEKWAKKQGATQLIGTVHHENTAMMNLNRQLGYQIEKHIMSKRI